MKKLFVLLWLVGCSVCAVFAQTDNGRDLSKYADDKFSDYRDNARQAKNVMNFGLILGGIIFTTGVVLSF